jgi:fructokinase
VEILNPMILVLGEVLIDRFPDDHRIGGAPLNFAFHLHQLGEPLRLVTRVGNDADGRRICKMLEAYGLATTDVQMDDHHPTGRVTVRLDADGVPTFDILAPAAYDFIDLQSMTGQGFPAPLDLIYFGSLVQRSDHCFAQVQQLLAERPPTTRCFCDINLRDPFFDRKRINFCVRHADILKLNEEELTTIGRVLNIGPGAHETVKHLMDECRIEMLAVTRGPRGSRVFYGDQQLDSPDPPSVDVRDTVGAGDAFAAVLAAGILNDRPMPQVLAAATDFAAHVCEQPGAIPAQSQIYEDILTKMGS